MYNTLHNYDNSPKNNIQLRHGKDIINMWD